MPDNKRGIDRWTSNGHGIKVDPLTPAQKKDIDKLNAELAAKKAKKPAAAKPKTRAKR